MSLVPTYMCIKALGLLPKVCFLYSDGFLIAYLFVRCGKKSKCKGIDQICALSVPIYVKVFRFRESNESVYDRGSLMYLLSILNY